jgi:hypothetical protein
MEVCQVEAKMFHADGQADADMTELTVTICNFANVFKNQ